MRSSLLPGLALALAHNLKRQNGACDYLKRLSLLMAEPFQEQRMLGLALMGSRASENWTEQSTRVDFFDMKGEVEQLLACSGGSVGFERESSPGYTTVKRPG